MNVSIFHYLRPEGTLGQLDITQLQANFNSRDLKIIAEWIKYITGLLEIDLEDLKSLLRDDLKVLVLRSGDFEVKVIDDLLIVTNSNLDPRIFNTKYLEQYSDLK